MRFTTAFHCPLLISDEFFFYVFFHNSLFYNFKLLKSKMYIQEVHILSGEIRRVGMCVCICTRNQCETEDQMPTCVTWEYMLTKGHWGQGGSQQGLTVQVTLD